MYSLTHFSFAVSVSYVTNAEVDLPCSPELIFSSMVAMILLTLSSSLSTLSRSFASPFWTASEGFSFF